jgi:hypothetical protein
VVTDVLSKLGSKRALVPAGVFIQDLRKLLIKLLSDPETPPDDVPSQGCRVVWTSLGPHFGGNQDPGFTEPVVTGPKTAGTGPTGPDRFRFWPVPKNLNLNSKK